MTHSRRNSPPGSPRRYPAPPGTSNHATQKHQIVTDKIRALGMQFGGNELLRQTVAELVEGAARAAR